jgi:hypothetical protein
MCIITIIKKSEIANTIAANNLSKYLKIIGKQNTYSNNNYYYLFNINLRIKFSWTNIEENIILN